MDRNAIRVPLKAAFHVGNNEGAAPVAVVSSAVAKEPEAGDQRPRLRPFAFRGGQSSLCDSKSGEQNRFCVLS